MTSTTSTRAKTAADILDVFEALNFDEVASHFDGDDDEIDPYVVCDGVSVNAFNKYIGDGEGLWIGLRFLCLSGDGEILVVDLPTAEHESTARVFEFLAATGNADEIAQRGSMTARRAANPKKEADATFGPMRDTLNRTRVPARRTVGDWVTLAVEVGRFQTWASLLDAASWWFGYAGMQHVLLLKINAKGRQLQYALYDNSTPTPIIITEGTFRHRAGAPPVNVTFDMRRILSIPANGALPNGVNPSAVVDLRIVLHQVIRTVGQKSF